jgi:hypothetical protein
VLICITIHETLRGERRFFLCLITIKPLFPCFTPEFPRSCATFQPQSAFTAQIRGKSSFLSAISASISVDQWQGFDCGSAAL